jgi:hypothetical protein
VEYSFLGAGRRARVARTVAASALSVGFADLAYGGITLAAVLLVVGYVVLVPYALIAE